jgi:hypothetical protein
MTNTNNTADAYLAAVTEVETVYQGVQDNDGAWSYTKVGVVEHVADGYIAYSLSDVAVYCGFSYLDACSTLRGER